MIVACGAVSLQGATVTAKNVTGRPEARGSPKGVQRQFPLRAQRARSGPEGPARGPEGPARASVARPLYLKLLDRQKSSGQTDKKSDD